MAPPVSPTNQRVAESEGGSSTATGAPEAATPAAASTGEGVPIITQPSPATDQRQQSRDSILAHRNAFGEPADPVLDALFASTAREAAQPLIRRSKRDRRPTERAAAALPPPRNFEEAFGDVAAAQIELLQGTDRDVTRLSVPEDDEEPEDEGIAAILNDPSIGRLGRRRVRGRRGDPKPAAGLYVMGGSIPPGAPAASILADEETAAARRRRFGGSGLLPPQVNANRVLVGHGQAAPTVPDILEAGEPVDQQEIDDEEEADELDQFHAEAAVVAGPTPKLDLEQLKKGVVAPSTMKSYQGCLNAFFHWCYDNRPQWLTALGKVLVEKLREPGQANEGKRDLQKRRTSTLEAALSAIHEQAALVNLHLISADEYMEYLLTLEKQVPDPDDASKKKSAPLSKSAYGAHRAALYHLFRMHNGIGYDMNFSKRLKTLFQSHKRWLSENLPAKSASGTGKEAVPVALYRFLCK